MGIRIGKVCIRLGFFLLLAALWLYRDIALPLIISVSIHEAGHLVGLMVCKATIEYFEFSLGGFSAVYDQKRLSYGQEAFCASLGPMSSLILAITSAVIGNIFSSNIALTTAGASLSLLIFNLMPISILDGGKVLHLLATRSKGPYIADRFIYLSDLIISASLLILSLIMMAFGKMNATLTLVSASLLILCCKRDRFSVQF